MIMMLFLLLHRNFTLFSLTFLRSCLIGDIIFEAISRNKKIKVIIVDSKPKFEGFFLFNYYFFLI